MTPTPAGHQCAYRQAVELIAELIEDKHLDDLSDTQLDRVRDIAALASRDGSARPDATASRASSAGGDCN